MNARSLTVLSGALSLSVALGADSEKKIQAKDLPPAELSAWKR